MVHDGGLLALATATRACKVSALDALDEQHSAVLVAPAGRSLRMSSAAAELVELVRSGQSGASIAARFGTSREAIDRAADELASRISRILEVPADTKLPGFLFQRALVPGLRVTRWASRAAWLYDRRVLPIVAVLALAVVALTRFADTGRELPTYALWGGFAVSVVLMFGHELGHAAACQSFGAPVGPIGCALYLIYPAFYCDVTHTWSLPRRARITVDLGGVYFQLIGTAAVALLWWRTDSAVLLAATRFSVATIAVNLLPLGRFDGYWVMSDLLGIIDLRGQQRRVAITAWARLRGRPVAVLPWPWWVTVAISGYAVASACFVVTVFVRFLPHVIVELWRLPARVARIAGAESISDAATTLGTVASSLVIAVVAVLLVRGMLRSVWRARQWNNAGTPGTAPHD